jgi:putative thioredoxin
MDQLSAAATSFVKDTTDQAFMADVIQESTTQPVIVDFWAPWCGPCKQLGPMLEKHVAASKGAVKMVKINIDENPQIAGRLRIQSIPAVYAFHKGQPVDGFMGAVPESQIKEFIKRLIASAGGGDTAIDDMLAGANEALDAGEISIAAQAFSQILSSEPDHAEAIAGLVRCYLATGDLAGARALVESAPEEARKSEALKSAEAQLALAEKAGPAGESAKLKAALDADPASPQARYDYAMALAAERQYEAAMDELLEIFKRDRAWEEEKARKELLNLFEAIGIADPLVLAARRKLSALMFR